MKQQNLYTVDQIATVMNGSKNVNISVLHQEQLFKWECFLDKHFTELPAGLTKFYFFEFSEGRVAIRKLPSIESPKEEPVRKDLVRN